MRHHKWLSIIMMMTMLAAWLPIGVLAAPPESPTITRRLATTGFKVLAAPGVLDAAQPGITLWHDYGSFALYRVDSATLTGLVSMRGQVTVLADADRLLLDAYSFDTQKDSFARIPAAYRTAQVTGDALQLIQFVGPIKDEWLQQVAAAGATPVHYVPNYGYLVWAGAAARANLAQLAQAGHIVQFSAPYQTYFKLGALLYQRMAVAKEETVDVVVQIYAHPGAADTKNLVQKLLVAQQSDWTDILVYQNIYGAVRVSDLATIAACPDVVWVGERSPRELYDEVQNQILAGNLDAGQAGPDSPGYLTWLADLGFSTNPADYPIVDVTDTGIGNGTINSGDNTLHYLGHEPNASRLVYVGNCTAEASGDDPLGHGHINASIVGGYDGRTGSPFQDPNGYLRGVGVSPYGRMAGTKVFDNDGHYDASACDYTDTGVIKHSQDLGAQISTNSWGADVGGDYDDAAQAYDVGVRDADLTQAGNQPLIIFFSAGNAGSGSSTIGSPGTGKNVITVGASENDRPSDEDGDWIDGCGIGPTGADNAMDIFDFSSRGPAEGSRVKPEVVAPGTHIQGTASPQSSYDGSGVCDSYRPSGQTEFAASSGTSHSTPALAGVSSLYYYWLENVYGLTPSPAMMKAYILAHPTYLTGVDANDTLPSNNQGYGMPNMGLAFDNSNRYFLDQTHLFIDTGQTWSDWGVVTNSAQPVRIVLAYTDAPGALGSDPQVNDLNLQVTVGGQTYLGNVFSGQWSTTGGSADANNNYEAVFLPAGVSGELEISVTAANIAGDGVPNNGDATDQDFALVAYNVSAAPAGRLEGYVTQAGTGAPIENALVAASNLTQTVNFSADAAGFYSGLLVTGDYTVTAAAYGYYPVTVAGISVISDAITTQDFALTAVPTFTVSGTVTDASTGWPLYAEINIDGYLDNPLYSDPVTGYYNVTLPDGVAYDFDVAPLIAGYLGVTGTVILSGSDVIQNFALDVDGLACAAPGYEMLSVLNEDLENVTFPPAGWAVYNVDGDGSQWARSAARVHSGAASAAHVCSASTAQDGWLRTPSIALEATSGLRFWENVNYASYYGKHSLWVCTTDCDAPPVNYTEVVEYSSPAEDAWVERMTDLSAYSGQTVYLAFRYEGTDAADWYIDDVLISGGCNPPVGGLVVGNVSDANTGDLLNSARVANAVGDVTTTAAFSGPAGEGFYSLYAPAGSSTMTATLSGYADAIESGVTITAGETVRQDFSLQAGWLHVAPDALHVTVPAGITSTRQLTISNANSAAASSFEIFTMGDSGQIALVVRQDTAAADALQSALTTLEVGFIAVTPDEFRALSVAELLDYEAIFYAGVLDSTASSGTDHTLLVSYLDGGGALYVSDNDLGYYHRDTDPTGFYGTYLQSTYVGDDPGIDALVGEDMMAGLNPDISADPYPDDLTVQAEGVRIFQFTGGNAAGVKVARNGYKAIYTSFDFNDIASAADELELVRRVAVFFGMMDVPWLDEAPTTGTVAGGGRVVVDMIFDSSVVTETGDYLATLELRDDSPYATIAIPVTMTVVPAYVITPTAGAGGSISPATPQTVMHGSDITFTSASDSGYHINDVWVDGGSVGAMGTYTFENVTADHTISATFAINTYVITPTAGVGGSVTPGTPQTVNYGDDVTFTIAADTGYHINDVWVDGGSVGAVGMYTFANVTADHSISATFAPDAYTLTVDTIGSGSVTWTPSQTIYLYGDVVTLTAAADPEWYFGQWSGDASGTLTQTAVTMTADKVVTATFVAAPPTHYTLTMSIVGSGVITPAAGIHSYLSGTLVSVSASPMEGWQFDGWSGGLESAANPAQLTMGADKAVTATFSLSSANHAPTADAGADQYAIQGDVVTLDGSGSRDPDVGDSLTYSWAQTGGPAITLMPGATISVTTFAAPSQPTLLTFTLTVTDSLGLSASDATVITVGPHRIYLPLVSRY